MPFKFQKEDTYNRGSRYRKEDSVQREEAYAANIDNLTELWRKMGTEDRLLGERVPLHISPSWPNRCWFDRAVDAAAYVQLAEVLEEIPARCAIPVWPGEDAAAFEAILREGGYDFSRSLDAMYLDLAGYSGMTSASLDVRMIADGPDIATWTALCSRAFGYDIDEAVIRRLAPASDIQLLLAHVAGEVAATALLYRSGDTIGIHQIGVSPDFRGQGVAKGLMVDVMTRCVASGSRYATLQASAAARGIYEGLGFQFQFTLKLGRRISVA